MNYQYNHLVKYSIRYRSIRMITVLTALLILTCGCSCTHKKQEESTPQDSIMRHAKLLKMTDHDGYTLVTILNPRDTLEVLNRLALVEKGGVLPDSLIGTYNVLNVPLTNTTVASAVHISLINSLGAADAIASVCDSKYIYEADIKERIDKGDIIDCGTVQNPDIEKILASGSEAFLISLYQGAAPMTTLEKGGTPVIDCAEYMELHPLGRAEWMRFYGRLYGKKVQADSLFEATEKEYITLADKVKDSNVSPVSVLTDLPYQGMWNLPGDKSSLGITISDAGGKNVIPLPECLGSESLAPEKVIVEGNDADIWLIRYNDPYPLDYKKISLSLSAAPQFKAFKKGNIYGADTSSSRIFEDASFMPQLLLADLISIFHPELNVSPEKKYYFRIKNTL